MQEANYKGFKIRAHAQLMAESRVEGIHCKFSQVTARNNQHTAAAVNDPTRRPTVATKISPVAVARTALRPTTAYIQRSPNSQSAICNRYR